MIQESHRQDRQADRAIRRFLRVFRFTRPPKARAVADDPSWPHETLEERRREVLLREEARARAMLMLPHR
jgi:hypothetical protein